MPYGSFREGAPVGADILPIRTLTWFPHSHSQWLQDHPVSSRLTILTHSGPKRSSALTLNTFAIRIRSFYMRKIKFTQQAFEERLDKILGDFPIMDVSLRWSQRRNPS